MVKVQILKPNRNRKAGIEIGSPNLKWNPNVAKSKALEKFGNEDREIKGK